MKTLRSGVFDTGGGRHRGTRDTKRSLAAGHSARMETQDALDQQAGGATTTAAAVAAAAPANPTREATVVSQGNGTQDSVGSRHEGQTAGVSSSRDSGGVGGGDPVAGAEEGLVTAWGLSDPMVARAMMKRAKRLRKFQTAEVSEVERELANRCCGWVCIRHTPSGAGVGSCDTSKYSFLCGDFWPDCSVYSDKNNVGYGQYRIMQVGRLFFRFVILLCVSSDDDVAA